MVLDNVKLISANLHFFRIDVWQKGHISFKDYKFL